MTIDIDKCTGIIGVAGISVSRIDDTIFISNDKTVAIGVPGTVAIYADEFGNIKSTEVSIDIDSNTLTAENIVASTIDNKCITSKLMQSSNIHSSNYYLTIDDDTLADNLFAKLGTYQYDGKYKFGIFLKNNRLKYSTAISIDKSLRVSIEDGKLNLRQRRTIISAIGSIADTPGDLAIDTEYLYYCHTIYNGKDPIWVRWKISDNNW
jgi:hypothetical protein